MVNKSKIPPLGKANSGKTRVKVCGITNLSDAKVAVAAGVDALGFIFYSKSKRYIAPQKAKEIIVQLPKSVKKVGVFVNSDKKRVRNIFRLCKLDVLQFHGDESTKYCKDFKNYAVIKAIRIKNRRSLECIENYKVSSFILDTFDKSRFGGTGKIFKWDLVKEIKCFNRPIILSGGLTANNIKAAIRQIKPYAVDASSGLEISPGRKDHKLIEKFVRAAKNTKIT